MKLTIERTALLKALGHVQSVVERRNTIPILANLLLSAGEGQVAVSATDLDMDVTDSRPAKVERAGQITTHAHTLYEIVRELPDGAEVSLDYTGQDPRLELRAGRSRFNLPVLPAGDFPMMPSDGLSDPIAIAAADLIRLIDKTGFAMSAEETRYFLNGLFFHPVEEDGLRKLRAVGTDGLRLALAETLSPQGFPATRGVIIPRKTVNEARRLMDDAGASVAVSVSAQKIRFAFGNATLTSKVIDGTFPAYANVVPRNNNRVMTLDNALFTAAVRRVVAVSAEPTRAVQMAIEANHMTLTVRTMDAGQAVEELEVDYGGEPFEIRFNARYVLDATAQIDGEVAQFRFAGPDDPALLRDPADAGVQYVLVPMRI
ncbi:MAG TPA: DNA polymerase III subunit beta [Caulobacteraceae bacterium]